MHFLWKCTAAWNFFGGKLKIHKVIEEEEVQSLFQRIPFHSVIPEYREKKFASRLMRSLVVASHVFGNQTGSSPTWRLWAACWSGQSKWLFLILVAWHHRMNVTFPLDILNRTYQIFRLLDDTFCLLQWFWLIITNLDFRREDGER